MGYDHVHWRRWCSKKDNLSIISTINHLLLTRYKIHDLFLSFLNINLYIYQNILTSQRKLACFWRDRIWNAFVKISWVLSLEKKTLKKVYCREQREYGLQSIRELKTAPFLFLWFNVEQIWNTTKSRGDQELVQAYLNEVVLHVLITF